MIKLTLEEAVTVSRALTMLPRINAKAAYDLARVRDKIKVALRPVNEQREEIIAAHGGETEGGVIKWKAPDGQAAADKEFADYMTKEIEVGCNPVKLEAILGPDPAKYPEIEPEVLSMLEKIIVE